MSNPYLNNALKKSYYKDDSHKVFIGSNELVNNYKEGPLDSNQFYVGGEKYDSSIVGETKGFSTPYATYMCDDSTGKISSVYMQQTPVLIDLNGIDYSFYNYKKKSEFNPNT
jgi:hypothetical protein